LNFFRKNLFKYSALLFVAVHLLLGIGFSSAQYSFGTRGSDFGSSTELRPDDDYLANSGLTNSLKSFETTGSKETSQFHNAPAGDCHTADNYYNIRIYSQKCFPGSNSLFLTQIQIPHHELRGPPSLLS